MKVTAIDLANRLFEAKTTAPDDDPIVVRALWDAGQADRHVTTSRRTDSPCRSRAVEQGSCR